MDQPDPLLSELCSIWYAPSLSLLLLYGLTPSTATPIPQNTAVRAAQPAPVLYHAHDATSSGPNAPECEIQPPTSGAMN